MRASRLILVDLSALLTSNNLLIHRAGAFKGLIVGCIINPSRTPIQQKFAIDLWHK